MKIIASVLAAALFASTALSGAGAATTPAPAAATDNAVNMPKPECETDFGQWMENLTREAREAGVGEKGIAELHKASIDQKVLGRDRKQTVFNLTFTEFSKRLISEARLKKGQENLVKYADVFKKVEDAYGVPGPVLAAFWGLKPTMARFRVISTRSMRSSRSPTTAAARTCSVRSSSPCSSSSIRAWSMQIRPAPGQAKSA